MTTPTQTFLPLTQTTPAPVADTAPDFAAAILDLARQAVDRQALGQRLSREELKAIREAAIFQTRDTHWPDRAAVAEGLGLTGKQLEALIAAGAPVGSHAPTPMVPLLRWYVQHLRAGGQVGADPIAQADAMSAQADAEDLRFRRLKNDRLEGAMVLEAEAQAMQALADVVRELKARLIYAVPDQLAEALVGIDDRRARLRLIRRHLVDTLTDAARRAGALDEVEAAARAADAAARKPKRPAKKGPKACPAPAPATI